MPRWWIWVPRRTEPNRDPGRTSSGVLEYSSLRRDVLFWLEAHEIAVTRHTIGTAEVPPVEKRQRGGSMPRHHDVLIRVPGTAGLTGLLVATGFA